MKKIVFGIDVSKEKIDVTAIEVRDGFMGAKKLGYNEYENRPRGFHKMLSWAKRLTTKDGLKDVLFCCETTGGNDRCLCDYLYGKDCDIWRESALQIKRSCGLRKGKDDKADSEMIAEYAMRHMDKAVSYESPDSNIRDLKALLSYRDKLMRQKTSLSVRMNEIKSTAAKSKTQSLIMQDEKRHIRELEKSIKKCEKEILQIIEQDEQLKKNYLHLTSIKGVGIVNATAMIVYTNNFKNISTANQMASYWGAAPFREQSGTSVNRKAHVGKYSSSRLKAWITEAAKHTVKENGIYREYYIRMKSKGKPEGVILNNAKNKLLHLAFELIKNDMDYEENHEILRLRRA